MRFLVISGGGSYGAFAVGVIKTLYHNQWRWDGIVGTSTGALIAPLVAIQEIALLEKMYTSVTTSDIIVNYPWNVPLQHAWYSTAPVKKLLHQHLTPTRYTALLHSAVACWVCTVNLQSGQVTYWHPRTSGISGKAMSRAEWIDAMLASASQPVLMPPVKLLDGCQHVDGGVREITPLKYAIQQGATEIDVMLFHPAGQQPIRPPAERITNIALRTLELLLAEIADNDLAAAAWYNETLHWWRNASAGESLPPFAAKRPITINVFRPQTALPGSSLEFSPPKMRQMVEMGSLVAQEWLQRGDT
jgi:NTE family protein